MENNNFNQFDQQGQYNQPMSNMPPQDEKANVGLAILSFFIPLVGLILFITKKDKQPKTAKACGISALVCVILSIISTVIMTVSGGLLLGSAVDETLSDDSSSNNASYSQDVDSNDNISTDNTLGDYGCVVSGAKLCKDWNGNDAVLVTYEFTNNSANAISFDVALDAKAYQDGIGLETAILESDETDYLDVDIKPGVTKSVNKAYVLRDTTTPIEVEVEEFFSFNDDKIVTTLNLPE